MPTVLFVCTANQCRSPMAEVICRDAAAQRQVAVTVGSAGFLPGGEPASDGAETVMAKRGLDLSGHVSRSVAEVALDAVDLTVCMTRDHLIRLVTDEHLPLERVLLAGEISARAEATPPATGEGLRGWLSRLDRTTAELLGAPAAWEVPDPMGGPRRGYVKCAKRLDEVVASLLDVLEAA